MASELKVDKITGVTTAGSIDVTGEGNSTTTNLQQGLAKTWCNFEQASSHTVRDSFNISSLTDVGYGLTNTNCTNNFANDDYVAAGHSGRQAATSTTAYWLFPTSSTVVYSTSATSWQGGYSISTSSGMGILDLFLALCTIHGELA
jgi:hypothetical protein|tara:strand:- start:620 stop:1057 length:438 start_codon:yes stop_codon:yes gene_type:complete